MGEDRPEPAAGAPGTWRLLQTPPAAGALNMAIDEVLAETCARGGWPTLRLYRWDPPAVSLGRFQRAERTVDVAACAARGIGLVRRPTGGRAILHDGELTYAVALAAGTPEAAGGVRASAARIHGWIAAGLRRLGVPATVGRPAAEAPGTRLCFSGSQAEGVLVRGAKLVGSAQRRWRGALLQHGSILIRIDLEAHRAIFPAAGADFGADLEGRIACLASLLGGAPPLDDLEAAIAAGVAEGAAVGLVEAPLTAAEGARAVALAARKYAAAAWTHDAAEAPIVA